jgi:hypothetical protein
MMIIHGARDEVGAGGPVTPQRARDGEAAIVELAVVRQLAGLELVPPLAHERTTTRDVICSCRAHEGRAAREDATSCRCDRPA